MARIPEVNVPEHGCTTPAWTELPCGNRALFERDGLSYRCQRCFAVVGSIGMPVSCKQLLDMERQQ